MSSPISGFTAIPNPYMIPLLFLQSLLIGAGFGIGYQGERRKLSAMSNEKFNELDLGMHAFNQFKEILARNDFGQMLDLMHPLTEKLASSFGELINNFPEIFKGFTTAATGGSTSSSGFSPVAGFTGGLPAVDSGIGNFFNAIAEIIRQGTGFGAGGGNPAQEFHEILKEEKQKNKQNAPPTKSELELAHDVQSKNIKDFQDKLAAESDFKKNIRKEVEKWAQLLVNAEIGAKKLKGTKMKQQYKIQLMAYYNILSKYNKAAADFRKTFPKQTGTSPTWEHKKPMKF